jgi:aminoglycoside 6'-N-acetyltransferase I
MLSSVTIRPAQRSDALAWTALRRELWPDEGDSHSGEVARFFDEPSADLQTWVAIRPDGELVGFLELGTRPYAEGCSSSPVPYIEGWYVRADARECGIGRGLMEAAEQWARDRGFREIASDAVLTNEASIAIHKHLGFEETERIVTFLKPLE